MVPFWMLFGFDFPACVGTPFEDTFGGNYLPSCIDFGAIVGLFLGSLPTMKM